MSVDLPVKQVSKKEEEGGNFALVKLFELSPQSKTTYESCPSALFDFWLLTAVGFGGKIMM